MKQEILEKLSFEEKEVVSQIDLLKTNAEKIVFSSLKILFDKSPNINFVSFVNSASAYLIKIDTSSSSYDEILDRYPKTKPAEHWWGPLQTQALHKIKVIDPRVTKDIFFERYFGHINKFDKDATSLRVGDKCYLDFQLLGSKIISPGSRNLKLKGDGFDLFAHCHNDLLQILKFAGIDDRIIFDRNLNKVNKKILCEVVS